MIDLTPHELGLRMSNLADELEILGEKYARLRATKETLDNKKSTKLALIVDKVEGKSNAERERKAKTTEEWKDYLHRMETTTLDYFLIKHKFDSALTNWKTAQSLLSSKRQEMKSL